MATATLELRLRAIDRAAGRSVSEQLVDAFVAAIADGELVPGAKLPPTRRLAELAGVNQLTAGRCYHRLAERGLVVSEVGRGTFVRAAATSPAHNRGPRDGSWQTYLLPPERGGAARWILAEMAQQASDPLARTIPLSAGYPPRELIPVDLLAAACSAAIKRYGAASFDYGPVAGDGMLRAELARLGRARGLDDDPGSIVVTTGARQAATLVARAVLRAGDKVACESPTYMGIIDAVQAVDAELLPVPVDEDGIDTDALEALLRRHEIRMVALQPRLQNPTGYDLSAARRTQLVELARRHGFFILEDAVYGDLRFAGRDPGALRALAPAHVIYIDSFSKTVGPGLRAGWIAASGPVLERLIAEKRGDDAHGAILPQQIVAAFLADGHYPAQLARARAIHRERRDALLDALDHELADCASFTRPDGGGYVWVTLNEPCDEGRLYRDALTAGVSFVPGTAMLIERPRATQLRLAFGLLDAPTVREGVRRLAAVIRARREAPFERESLPMN